MTKPFSMELWQQTADFILPVLIAEPMVDESNDHYWHTVEQNIRAEHFPEGQWREVWNAITQLILDGQPIHITTLQAQCNGSVSSEQLALWYAMYSQGSTLRNHVFTANLEHLRAYGQTAYLMRELHEAADTLMAGKVEIEVVVSDTINKISNVGGHGISGETAGELATDFAEFLSTPQNNKTLRMGVELPDGWIGGLTRGDFFAIAAAMKQRKTSLLLNMLINMARNGKSVALMMLESNRRMVNAMIVSMLAIEYIIAKGWYFRVEEDNFTPINRIWASNLVRIGANYKQMGAARVAAIDYGIGEFHKIKKNLRVYDKTKEGGELNNIASIQRISLRDKALYDTDLIAIDHAQRINEGGNDYEKLSKVVPYLETLARRENIAICLLAQLKAGTAEGTGDQHLSGVRGGSVLDEAVDYMLITGYKQKLPDPQGDATRYPNDVLMIGLQHSRYGDGGSHKRAFVGIDPNSGLIVNGGKPLTSVSMVDQNIMKEQ